MTQINKGKINSTEKNEDGLVRKMAMMTWGQKMDMIIMEGLIALMHL